MEDSNPDLEEISASWYASDLWGSELVHIYVGGKKKRFSVHKKLLCSTSAFFDKAFNTGFQEAQTGEMVLPDDTTYVFQGFVRWMYYGKLGDLAPDDMIWHPEELVDLYLFGVAKCCNRLKNDAIDALQDCLDEGPTQGLQLYCIDKIYSNAVSTHNAPIRKFCCALIRWHQCQTNYSGKWTEDELAEFFKSCPDVLQEYFKFQTEIWGNKDDEESPLERNGSNLFNMCYFHVHGDGEQCNSMSDYYLSNP